MSLVKPQHMYSIPREDCCIRAGGTKTGKLLLAEKESLGRKYFYTILISLLNWGGSDIGCLAVF